MENLLKKTEQAITEHGLIARGDRVLVGVSGGADSVALLLALCALGRSMGFDVCAAHLNHGIRGEAANGDEAFVRGLCQSMGVKLSAGHANVPELAASEGKTLEQAARDARYTFLEGARCECGAASVAVAHHMDDQAESILLHLIRGSGLAGLTGMRPRRGSIIRPFLGVRRCEIEDFLKERGTGWRTDETNLERDASRNKVRLDVIPYINENLNPCITEALCSMGELLRLDEDYLTAKARELLKSAKTEAGYERAKLAAQPWPVQSRALRIAMAEAGAATDIDRVHVERAASLLKAQTGASADLAHIAAWVSYESICFGQRTVAEEFETPFEIDGKTCVPDGFFLAERVEGDIIKDNSVAYFDMDKLPAGVVARRRRNGDRFYPLGAPGEKKLKDFFIDRKTPRQARDVPILFCGANALFIPGAGISESVKVTKGTMRVLRVAYQKYS